MNTYQIQQRDLFLNMYKDAHFIPLIPEDACNLYYDGQYLSYIRTTTDIVYLVPVTEQACQTAELVKIITDL